MTGMERLLPSYDMRLNQPFGPVLKPWDLLTRAWASTNAGHGLSANPGIGRRGGAAAKHKNDPTAFACGFLRCPSLQLTYLCARDRGQRRDCHAHRRQSALRPAYLRGYQVNGRRGTTRTHAKQMERALRVEGCPAHRMRQVRPWT